MPEANVLYSVTAAVVLGLVTWVAVVLKTAKEPWARDLPKPAPRADDVPLETPAENEMTSEGGPAADADAASTKSPSPSSPNVVAGGATAGADTTAEPMAAVVAKRDAPQPEPKVDASEADADPKAHATVNAKD